MSERLRVSVLRTALTDFILAYPEDGPLREKHKALISKLAPNPAEERIKSVKGRVKGSHPKPPDVPAPRKLKEPEPVKPKKAPAPKRKRVHTMTDKEVGDLKNLLITEGFEVETEGTGVGLRFLVSSSIDGKPEPFCNVHHTRGLSFVLRFSGAWRWEKAGKDFRGRGHRRWRDEMVAHIKVMWTEHKKARAGMRW